METRILLRIDDAAEKLAISRRSLYTLIATNPDIRAAVVHIPGLRGSFIHADRLRKAIDRMAPADENGKAAA